MFPIAYCLLVSFIVPSSVQYRIAEAEDCREGFKVVGNDIVERVTNVPSIINCNLRCLKNENCAATNYQMSNPGDLGQCELLLPHDLEAVQLIRHAKAVYTRLMKQNHQHKKKLETEASKTLQNTISSGVEAVASSISPKEVSSSAINDLQKTSAEPTSYSMTTIHSNKTSVVAPKLQVSTCSASISSDQTVSASVQQSELTNMSLQMSAQESLNVERSDARSEAKTISYSVESATVSLSLTSASTELLNSVLYKATSSVFSQTADDLSSLNDVNSTREWTISSTVDIAVLGTLHVESTSTAPVSTESQGTDISTDIKPTGYVPHAVGNATVLGEQRSATQEPTKPLSLEATMLKISKTIASAQETAFAESSGKKTSAIQETVRPTSQDVMILTTVEKSNSATHEMPIGTMIDIPSTTYPEPVNAIAEDMITSIGMEPTISRRQEPVTATILGTMSSSLQETVMSTTRSMVNQTAIETTNSMAQLAENTSVFPTQEVSLQEVTKMASQETISSPAVEESDWTVQDIGNMAFVETSSSIFPASQQSMISETVDLKMSWAQGSINGAVFEAQNSTLTEMALSVSQEAINSMALEMTSYASQETAYAIVLGTTALTFPASEKTTLLETSILTSLLPTISTAQNVVTSSTAALSLPCSVETTSGRCYSILTNSLTWAEAKANCQGLSGNLATVETAAQCKFLYRMRSAMSLSERKFHIGLTKATSGSIAWIDGSVVSATFLSALSVDEDCDSDLCCGFLHKTDTMFVTILIDSCTDKFPFICEWQV